VASRSCPPEPLIKPRSLPTASSSSMKTTDGAYANKNKYDDM